MQVDLHQGLGHLGLLLWHPFSTLSAPFQHPFSGTLSAPFQGAANTRLFATQGALARPWALESNRFAVTFSSICALKHHTRCWHV
jgi:hypothetical protein